MRRIKAKVADGSQIFIVVEVEKAGYDVGGHHNILRVVCRIESDCRDNNMKGLHHRIP